MITSTSKWILVKTLQNYVIEKQYIKSESCFLYRVSRNEKTIILDFDIEKCFKWVQFKNKKKSNSKPKKQENPIAEITPLNESNPVKRTSMRAIEPEQAAFIMFCDMLKHLYSVEEFKRSQKRFNIIIEAYEEEPNISHVLEVIQKLR